MRLVFAGTPVTAVPSLLALLASAHEVVGLVLHGPCEQVGALDGRRLAVHRPPAGDDLHRTGGLEVQTGQRQAALEVALLVLTEAEVGVDEVPDDAVDVVGEHPQADSQLRSREPRSPGVEHRVGQVTDESAQLGVEVDDRLGRGAQDGVAEQPDGCDTHAGESRPSSSRAAAC